MEKTLLLVLLLSGLSLESTDIVRKYHYVDAAQPWLEAQAHCREVFVDLATVASPEDNGRLLKAMRGGGGGGGGGGSQAWIGLRDDLAWWMWSGSKVPFNNHRDYSNWEKGRLNITKNRNKCALMKTGGGVWRDVGCWERHPSVCHDEDSPDTYVLVNKSMKWKDASNFCQAHHKHLVSVRNSSTNQRVASLLSANAWIGLHRSSWVRWSDHARFRFRNWRKPKTDSEIREVESCVSVDASTGLWVGDDCQRKRPFVCYSVQKRRDVRVKLKVRSRANLRDPAVNRQILEQLHAKLAKNISEFVIQWAEKDGHIFHQETEEAAGRVADPGDGCAGNITSSQAKRWSGFPV